MEAGTDSSIVTVAKKGQTGDADAATTKIAAEGAIAVSGEPIFINIIVEGDIMTPGGFPPALSVLDQVATIIREAGCGREEAWVRAHFEETWRAVTPHCRVKVKKVMRVAFGDAVLQSRFEVYAKNMDAGPYAIQTLTPKQVFAGRKLALLWHGTTCCDAICKEGFRQCMSRSGAGIWFATQAGVSMCYAHSGEMLLALVAVGNNGHGSGYSSLAGGVVVIYDDHAAIPMFRVIFDAKK